MKPSFECFNAAYQTRGGCEIDSGIQLGRGATVTMTDLTTRPATLKHRTDGIVIVATYTVELTVVPQKVECDGCGDPAPGPEADHDALMYLLENQDDGRLVWADGEDEARGHSDHYPVKGWQKVGGLLLCPECQDAAQAAITARKKAKAKTKAK